jgi:hypothetical protein
VRLLVRYGRSDLVTGSGLGELDVTEPLASSGALLHGGARATAGRRGAVRLLHADPHPGNMILTDDGAWP